MGELDLRESLVTKVAWFIPLEKLIGAFSYMKLPRKKLGPFTMS